MKKSPWNSFKSKKRPKQGDWIVVFDWNTVFFIKWEKRLDEIPWPYWMPVEPLEPLPKGENK